MLVQGRREIWVVVVLLAMGGRCLLSCASKSLLRQEVVCAPGSPLGAFFVPARNDVWPWDLHD